MPTLPVLDTEEVLEALQWIGYRAGPWQRTPWYLFWRKPWRRRIPYMAMIYLNDSAGWQYVDHDYFLTH